LSCVLSCLLKHPPSLFPEAISRGSLTLSVWMQVVRTMEDALEACSADIWDDAFAFYHGLGGASNGSLNLLYQIAQENCARFGTCESSTSIAKVNRKVSNLFDTAQAAFQSTKCDELKPIINQIVDQMTIPLVQGLLYSMYEIDIHKTDRENVQATAAAYMTALLPRLDQCNSGRANSIYADAKIGGAHQGSFEVVKDSLEALYECLGITCEDVGGLVKLSDPTSYQRNASPCSTSPRVPNNPNPSSPPSLRTSSNKKSGILVAVLIPLLLVGVLFTLFKIRKRTTTKEFDTGSASTGKADDAPEDLQEFSRNGGDEDEFTKVEIS